MKAYIIGIGGTLGIKKWVSERKKDFSYNKGIYYIDKEKRFLKKGFIGYSPCLWYIEGYALPINVNNIEILKLKDDEGKILDIPGNIFIPSNAIHELTSKKLLSVLTNDQLSLKDIIIIALLFIILLVSIAGVFS